MIILPILFGVSIAALIAGMVWILAARGVASSRQGPEVGRELQEEKMAREARGWRVFSKSFFRGKGRAWEINANVGFDEMKAAWRERRWGLAVPCLMSFIGIVGAPLFGGLSMVFLLHDPAARFFGGIFAAFSVYAFIRTAIWFWKA